MRQTGLFDGDRERYDDGTYPDGFWDWLEGNRHIYSEFVRLARRAKRRGVKRWSARSIIHVMRWYTALREHTAEHTLKINDHASPGLARLAMAKESDLAGFFETRQPPARKEARKLDGHLYFEQSHPAAAGPVEFDEID